MEGISKIMMSSFFFLGLLLVVPRTAAQTSTTCAAVDANMTACADLFSVGAGVDVGADVGVGVGVDTTPPGDCCTGLQQIEAIEAKVGAQTTCQCLRQNRIFSNSLNISLSAAIMDDLLGRCAFVAGANISIDLGCLHV